MSKVEPPRPYDPASDDYAQPKPSLTDDEEAALASFRKRLSDLSMDQQAWADDACLVRYLRARDFKLDPAEKLLRGTLEWRDSYNVEGITPADIHQEARSGKNYLHGTDKHGRPVIYQRPRRQNTKTYDLQVKQMAYLLERSVNSMDSSKGIQQHVLFIDFKGYSIFNAPPMSVSKQVLSLLMDRYPERLGAAFMVDAPMLFTTTYNILRPFIPAATKAKVNFVKRRGNAGRHGKMHPKIAEHFDDDDLEEEYGGTLTSEYDHEEYMAKEQQYWEQQRGIQQAKRAHFRAQHQPAAALRNGEQALDITTGVSKGFDVDGYLRSISSAIPQFSC
eukprot:TRINITY_DN7666_c0_g1_i2.p1 TRINITY_DN7666_c0_g1~~TRINITY_DN7666_c0_g1_i2.p1  ORF type:complete len:333 (+),score=65.95 TRINITY_DN7666_c0_g1_i2:129-1127(+)